MPRWLSLVERRTHRDPEFWDVLTSTAPGLGTSEGHGFKPRPRHFCGGVTRPLNIP